MNIKQIGRILLGVSLVAVLVFGIARIGGNFRGLGEQPAQWRLSQLYAAASRGEISKADISANQVEGTTLKGQAFVTPIGENPYTQTWLTEYLVNHSADVNEKSAPFSDSVMTLVISCIFPALLFVGFWLFVMRQAQAGGNQALSFGRSKARRLTDSVPKVTFEDVAGVDEAKSELAEVVEFLKNAKKFQALGAKIPKGVLLLGPPGCGKTMLARAIAGEAGVPFFHISGSDFVEMFVGVGASRVRDLFETAKANRPALIFIDEIDAVGRQRGAGLGGGHDEREQTLNQLLVEMDGFDQNSGVIMIAATNRPDVLDPALLRPGRFDRQVTVDVPDANGRTAILHIHAKGKPLADDIDIEKLARRTPGFTGADLANLVNEAAILAARRDKSKIDTEEFNEAIDRVIAGPERKSKLLNENEKHIVAYHELGHAIVGELLPNANPVHKVSILPRGRALGYTMHMPTEDRYLVTKSQFIDEISTLLGGRVAEHMIFNEITTGASNDFERATAMARAMVCQYGMSDKIGPLVIGGRPGNPFLGRDWMEERNYSDEMALQIDKEVRSIIDSCYNRAKDILDENRDKMENVVKVLLEKESLEREEFINLMRGASAPDSTEESTPSAPNTPITEPPVFVEKEKPNPVRLPNLRPEPGVA